MVVIFMNVIDRFGIKYLQKDDDYVIFFMEDTFNFEVWILDFQVGYTMNHFVDGSLDQIIISAEDFSKIEKYL